MGLQWRDDDFHWIGIRDQRSCSRRFGGGALYFRHRTLRNYQIQYPIADVWQFNYRYKQITTFVVSQFINVFIEPVAQACGVLISGGIEVDGLDAGRDTVGEVVDSSKQRG